MSTHTSPAHRYPLLDWLRTGAIVLMFIYHFAFDLQSVGLISAATFEGIAMTAIGRTCLALFMFCVGYSLALGHAHAIQWRKFWQRWFKIAAAAALVSLATRIFYPDNWIMFGILHCIALTSLLLLPVLRHHWLALGIGLGMLAAYASAGINLPFPGDRHPALDFIPPWPWSWSAFVGAGAAHFRLHEKLRLPHYRSVETVSRHSLLIYLVHQPVLMAIAYGLWRWNP